MINICMLVDLVTVVAVRETPPTGIKVCIENICVLGVLFGVYM